MTEKFTAAFGKRVKRMRRAAGYRSTSDLAEMIRNPAITGSVLQNIESGRKAEVSVVHLLEIARALEVTPIVLLADFTAPDENLSIDGLGPNFSRMTAAGFDAWLQGRNEWPRDPQIGLPEEVNQLLNVRFVDGLRFQRQARLERVQQALRLRKKYDAPAEFEALRRALFETEVQLRQVLAAGRRSGIRYDAALDPESLMTSEGGEPDPPRGRIPSRGRRPRYVDAER